MKLLQRVLALGIGFCLLFEQSGFAQVAPQVMAPAYLSGKLPSERFRPLHLRSVSIDPATRSYGLILDKGDNANVRDREVAAASKKLLEYFKVGLRLPDEKFWVNLRPDTDRGMIDPYLERTDIGKVFLAADVQLKKDVARFTSPDTRTGREYWNRLYGKAASLFGADEDVEIPTVTRPWIVPGEVVLARTPQGAYVYKAVMQVKLEEDWLNTPAGAGLAGYTYAVSEDPRVKELNAYSAQLLRELVIPQLTREVNSSKRYSELRQVFYSLVLAQWFKQSRKSQAQAVESVDSLDLSGISSKKSWSKLDYYRAYRTSFERGEYNKEERVAARDGITIRRYFSGGIDATDFSSIMMNRPGGVGLTPDMAGVVVSENGAVAVQTPIGIGSANLNDGGVARDQKLKIEAFAKAVAALTDSEITVERVRELISASGIQLQDPQVLGLLKKRLSETKSPSVRRNVLISAAVTGIIMGLLGADILSMALAGALVAGGWAILSPVAPGAKFAQEYLDDLNGAKSGAHNKDGGLLETVVNEPMNLYYAVTAVWSVLTALVLHGDRSVVRKLPYESYSVAGLAAIFWGVVSYFIVGYLDEGLVAQGAAVFMGAVTGGAAGTWIYKVTGGEYDGGIVEEVLSDPMKLYAAVTGVFSLVMYHGLKTIPEVRQNLTPQHMQFAGINVIFWGVISYFVVGYLDTGLAAQLAAGGLGWITGSVIGIWLYKMFGGTVTGGIKYMRTPEFGADKTEKTIDDGTVIKALKKDGGSRKAIGEPVSAASVESRKFGGIDFRAAITEQSRPGAVTSGNVPVLSPAQLEKSWAGIAAQLRKGVVPYAQVKSYILACERGRDTAKLARAVMSINTILRFEEDAACATNSQMRDILAVLK